MANVKTAISMEEPLLKEVDALAREISVPRSRIFVRAVEEFIERHRNRQLLDRINEAYADEPDPAERDHRSRMRAHHRKLVEGQW
jgi:metal-responsive CopG/Arc/MetJ family transcriptional regulator